MRCAAFFVSVLVIAEICSVWSIETFTIYNQEIDQHRLPIRSTNGEWTCTLDADCTTTNSSCVNQRCQCPPHHVFNAAMTSCLKAATSYGDSCEETSQCTALLLAGGFCNKGVCTCSNGYHYIHGRCYKTVDLYHKCRSDDDCYVNADFGAVSCKEHCVCSEGYKQREYRTCRLVATESGGECTIDQDCIYDKNAKCDRDYSVCYVDPKNNTEKNVPRDARYTAPKNVQDEVIPSGVFPRKGCTNDKECAVLGQASCDLTTGVCACNRGHFSDPTMPRCVPELGERCEEGDVSIIKNAICRFGLWGCKGATVASKNNRICRKAVTSYGDYCTYDEQCYVFGPDAVCDGNTCRCNKDSHYTGKALQFCWMNMDIGEICAIDEDCYVPGFGSDLVCNAESVCACPPNTHINVAGTACAKDAPVLGDACSGREDCEGIKHSMCRNGACTCAPSYFESEGVCAVGIGAECEVDSDCKTEHAFCDKKCRCQPLYVPSGADLCVRGVDFGGDCQFDAECLANTTKSFCNDRGKCDCYNDHHYRDGRCYRIRSLGDECDWSNDECWDKYHPDSMSCNIHNCRCNEGFKPSYNWIYCEKMPENASSSYMFSSFLGLTMLATIFAGLL